MRAKTTPSRDQSECLEKKEEIQKENKMSHCRAGTGLSECSQMERLSSSLSLTSSLYYLCISVGREERYITLGAFLNFMSISKGSVAPSSW